MSKQIHNPSVSCPTTGFTLIELMVALALSLVLFGLAFTLAQQLGNTADVVGSMSDVNENLRAAVNMVSRDLAQAGQNIPVGGIPIPSSGSATAINRPGPGTLTFPATGYMPVLTPGYQLGRVQGSGTTEFQTDIVTIIGVNQFSSFNQTAVNTTTSSPTISSTSATITVSTTAAGYVSPGQLIMLTNPNSSCLLAVSSVSVNATNGVITFNHGDTTNDPLGVNQFPTLSANGTITAGPTSGTILQLETATTSGNTTTYTWPATLTAYPISMTTYYLDNTNPGGRLMKQIIMGTAQPVALGINVMTITYTCSGSSAPITTRNPSSPNTIQKVAVTMIGETNHQNHISQQWYSKSITNAVAIQNLDCYNKYNLNASLTQN
jgi:prepilin-type N-terminal cleavage/methylation domain-containing protein